MHLENIVPLVYVYTWWCAVGKSLIRHRARGRRPLHLAYGPADGHAEEKKPCGRFEKINGKTIEK